MELKERLELAMSGYMAITQKEWKALLRRDPLTIALYLESVRLASDPLNQDKQIHFIEAWEKWSATHQTG